MTTSTSASVWLVLFSFTIFLVGCTGPMVAEDADPEPVDEVEEPAVINMADYEDFDASAYREEEPEVEVELEHDVPEALMAGRADRGATQRVQGYRVQVYSSQDRSAAEEVLEDAHNWWQGLDEDRPTHLFRDGLPVHITYHAPYYRVRIGDFASRQRAQEALEFLQDAFGDAFIAPDTVTITR